MKKRGRKSIFQLLNLPHNIVRAVRFSPYIVRVTLLTESLLTLETPTARLHIDIDGSLRAGIMRCSTTSSWESADQTYLDELLWELGGIYWNILQQNELIKR